MSSSIEIPSPKASIGRYLNQGSASHSLLGGDTTDDIYKFHQRTLAVKRRNSESELSTHSESLLNDGDNVPIFASDLRVPGMFRRNFITHRLNKSTGIKGNFIDFLSLYGKYAGDEDKDQESDDDDDEFLDAQESLPLVPPSTNHVETTSGKKAFFLLIKSFVGTGL